MIKNVFELSQREEIKILGLMSGTSADGLDIACVKFSGFGKYPQFEVLDNDFIPYPEKFSILFKKPLDLSAAKISELHFELGKWYGETISTLNMEYDVVANHGQTLLHNPPAFTLQIGEGQCIANTCGKPVIYDFRSADVMLGGQGAPLIPVLDEFLLRDEKEVIIALNMGGIANLTLLPPKYMDDPILAWDTGPANTLIDKAVIEYTKGKENFDRDGNYAEQGCLDQDLLDLMLDHDYLKRAIPKSAGQEQFGHEYYHFLKKKADPFTDTDWMNFIKALSEFTILSVTNDIRTAIRKYDLPVRIIASGGGAQNQYIMKRMSEALPTCKVQTFDLPGISSDIKEAFGFAYLGYLFLRGLPGNIPSVTGASREAVLGKIVF